MEERLSPTVLWEGWSEIPLWDSVGGDFKKHLFQLN